MWTKWTKQTEIDKNGLKCYADVTWYEHRNNKYYTLFFRYYIDFSFLSQMKKIYNDI